MAPFRTSHTSTLDLFSLVHSLRTKSEDGTHDVNLEMRIAADDRVFDVQG